MKAAILALLLAGCAGDDGAPTGADAAVVEFTADAQTVCEPTGDCCALLPDEDATVQCFVAGLPTGGVNGICAAAVCRHADCTATKLEFCAPSTQPRTR